MALRPVGADRLAFALLGAQPADEHRAEQQTDGQRGRGRRAGPEADVADEVENTGEPQLLGNQIEHVATPPAIRSTSFASPIELDALTSTASPGRTSSASSSLASSALLARSTQPCRQRVLQRLHILADQDQMIDLGLAHRGSKPRVKLVGMFAELAHRAEHGDPPLDVALLSQRLQRRRHRRRIGVVAFVDQQIMAAFDRQPMALAAALEAAHVGQRQAGDCQVGAHRLDRRQHGQRIHHPMVAALGYGVGELALDQPRRDQASAIAGTHRVDRANVGVAMAEGEGLIGIFARGSDQPVTVGRIIWDNCDALGLKPFEYLRLGVGDRLHRSEIFDMRRGKRGDHRDMRPDQPGQRGDLALRAHPHFEHCKLAVARHPGEAQGHAGMIIVALDGTMDLAPGEPLERCVERFLGRGLADRACHAQHLAGHPLARGDGEVGQRLRHIRDEHMWTIDRLRNQRRGGARGKGPGNEVMPVGHCSRHGDEQMPMLDLAAVEGDAGHFERRAVQRPAGRGDDFVAGP